MKPLFWSICLVFCASALRAQTCYDYDCVMLKVKKLLKEFERKGLIPKERQPDVEKIKALLQKEYWLYIDNK